jgi:hypothetical protein
MHVGGKSDGRVVPEKPPNNAGATLAAEAVEGRRPTEGNASKSATLRTQSRVSVSIGLERVRKAARQDRRARFSLTNRTASALYSAVKLRRFLPVISTPPHEQLTLFVERPLFMGKSREFTIPRE